MILNLTKTIFRMALTRNRARLPGICKRSCGDCGLLFSGLDIIWLELDTIALGPCNRTDGTLIHCPEIRHATRYSLARLNFTTHPFQIFLMQKTVSNAKYRAVSQHHQRQTTTKEALLEFLSREHGSWRVYTRYTHLMFAVNVARGARRGVTLYRESKHMAAFS